MRLTPFAIIYGGQLAPNVLLSSVNNVVAGTVTAINLAIAEIIANYANYGYGAAPALPTLPTIPTPGTTAPQAIAYFQSTSPGGARPDFGPSTSFLLIDAFTANGYSDPQSALDTLTADTTLANIILALAVLGTAAQVAITVQPTNQSVAAGANGAIALTATGTGRLYQWYVKMPTEAYYKKVVAGSVLSTETTTSLTITAATAAYNGAKFRCIVSDITGRQQLASNIVTLTVT